MRSLFLGQALAVLAAWILCAADGRLAADPAPDARQVSASETPFLAVEDMWCLDLFTRMARERKGNLCLSPLSLNSAMGIVQEGSCGQTRRDLIELTKTDDLLRRVCRLAGDLEARRDLEFVHGTVVAFDPRVRVASDWNQRLKEAGCSPSRVLPLRSEPHKAAAEINREVSRQTRGRIPVLVEPSSLEPTCFVYIGQRAVCPVAVGIRIRSFAFPHFRFSWERRG